MDNVHTTEDIDDLRTQLSSTIKCIIDIKDLILYLPKSDEQKLIAILERLGVSKEEKEL